MSNIWRLKSYSNTRCGCHYSLAAYYAWDSYYSDQYSDDDYTDEEDLGSEYDDERSEYDDAWDSGSEYDDGGDSGGDSGSEYSSEEDYDAIYLTDNTRSWNRSYVHTSSYMYMYRTPSYSCESKPVTTPKNSASKFNRRDSPASSISMPKNDRDRRPGYNSDNMQKGYHSVNGRTNNRTASMPPISYGRASSEREKSASPRQRRAATCEPRLLFAPTPGAKSSVAKGREFEDYFKMGVERARGNITAKVEFQKKLNVTPG